MRARSNHEYHFHYIYSMTNKICRCIKKNTKNTVLKKNQEPDKITEIPSNKISDCIVSIFCKRKVNKSKEINRCGKKRIRLRLRSINIFKLQIVNDIGCSRNSESNRIQPYHVIADFNYGFTEFLRKYAHLYCTVLLSSVYVKHGILP